MSEADEMFDELTRTCRGFTRDELAPLLEMARRIETGRTAYGPLMLAGERRDMRKELLAELMDAVNYLTWDIRKTNLNKE